MIRFPLRAAPLAAALLAAAPLVPVRAHAEDLLAQYIATDRFRSGQPRAFAFTPDGGEVLFLRSGPRDRVNDLWAFSPRTGRERSVATAGNLLAGTTETLTPEERARRERMRLSARGLATFELSRDGRLVLVPLSGRLFVIERESGAVRELSPGSAPAEDARFSPDGAEVACVRAGDVCVIDLATGAERRITSHAGDRITWGLPEFVAQEEMDRFAGYWWSPDSKWLLVQRTDETNVERMRIADPAHPEQPPQEWAYPRPGRTNADVKLAILSAAGGEPTWIEWDRTRYPYLCAASWPEHAPPTLLVMDRQQQQEALLAADPATGATRALFVERDSAWLDLPVGAPRWTADGRSLLWIAERDDSGPWLERRAADGGEPKRLTPPGLRVRELLGVDEKANAAFVLADLDPRETHVWRVPLDGRGAPRRLGTAEGTETAKFASLGGLHVEELRPPAGAPRWTVADGEGRALGTLASRLETPLEMPRVEWTVVGRDSLRACIVRPRDFDPRRSYPVIDWAYGGPHALQVTHAANPYVIPQWLADHGFVVVSVDGRGTPGRGRTWERAIRGDFIGPALADHLEGLEALCAAHPEMDAKRIGVMGWSFGGYFSVLAAERAPETYRAAVAGAPVVDWHDYDTFYTERYIGLPGPDSLAYERSSALRDAAKLSRPLLVIHGTADDNVYFFHSLKLADVLDRAGRSFEFLPLPGQTHLVGDAAMQRQVDERAAEFFSRELGPPGDAAPPRP
ncbi:MAG TPA: DPP IV N-terminal domain-containing protein [Candidatus Acidoferrales bacterium]|nr:DPP IV N-terminal domain-containing protein [Candidatus Acidoferrales bacterium]